MPRHAWSEVKAPDVSPSGGRQGRARVRRNRRKKKTGAMQSPATSPVRSPLPRSTQVHKPQRLMAHYHKGKPLRKARAWEDVGLAEPPSTPPQGGAADATAAKKDRSRIKGANGNGCVIVVDVAADRDWCGQWLSECGLRSKKTRVVPVNTAWNTPAVFRLCQTSAASPSASMIKRRVACISCTVVSRGS